MDDNNVTTHKPCTVTHVFVILTDIGDKLYPSCDSSADNRGLYLRVSPLRYELCISENSV